MNDDTTTPDATTPETVPARFEDLQQVVLNLLNGEPQNRQDLTDVLRDHGASFTDAAEVLRAMTEQGAILLDTDMDTYSLPPGAVIARDGDWWVMFELEMHSGKLIARGNDGRGPRLTNRGLWDDGRQVWVRGEGFDRAPERIGWTVPRYLTAADADRYMQAIRPLTDRLLEAVQWIPQQGAEGAWWDWTVEAAALYRQIAGMVLTGFLDGAQDADEEELAEYRKGLVPFEDVASHVQDNPFVDFWDASGMSDAAMEETAHATAARPLYPSGHVQALRKRAGWGPDVQMWLVGVRAGLWRLRAEQAKQLTGLPPVDAAEYYRDRALPMVWHFGSATTDENLLAMAGKITAVLAERDGIHLVGLEEYLRGRRQELRERRRAELSGVGNECAWLEERLKSARAERQELLRDVLSWGDPEEYDEDGYVRYTAVGTLAHMSRQGVKQLADKMRADGDWPEALSTDPDAAEETGVPAPNVIGSHDT